MERLQTRDISPELMARAATEARRQGLSFVQVLEKALVGYLKRQEEKRKDERFLLWRSERRREKAANHCCGARKNPWG